MGTTGSELPEMEIRIDSLIISSLDLAMNIDHVINVFRKWPLGSVSIEL